MKKSVLIIFAWCRSERLIRQTLSEVLSGKFSLSFSIAFYSKMLWIIRVVFIVNYYVLNKKLLIVNYLIYFPLNRLPLRCSGQINLTQLRWGKIQNNDEVKHICQSFIRFKTHLCCCSFDVLNFRYKKMILVFWVL